MRKLANKKAQISAFIAFGIIIVGAIGLSLFMGSETEKKALSEAVDSTAEDISPAQIYIDECIDESISIGLLFQGSQGGYLENLPDELIDFEFTSIPYYYYDNKEDIPTLDIIEEELNSYISYALPDCIQGLDAIEEYNITIGNVSSKIFITNDLLLVKINYPITIVEDTKRTVLDKFTYSKDIKIPYILAVAKDIIETLKGDSDWVDLNYFTTFEGVEISLYPIDETTMVYGIADNSTIYEDDPFTLMFAVELENE